MSPVLFLPSCNVWGLGDVFALAMKHVVWYLSAFCASLNLFPDGGAITGVQGQYNEGLYLLGLGAWPVRRQRTWV